MSYNWKEIVDRLNQYVKLRRTPIGIKSYDSLDEMAQVEKLRRPKCPYLPCQMLGQAIQLGTTIGFTADDVAAENCACTVGLMEQNEEFRSGKAFVNGWCASEADAAAHHGALTAIEKPYAGIVASPLSAGRIDPDMCMLVLSPGQAFMLLSGYLRNDYKPMELIHVGESSCSMHWVRTLKTGKVGLCLPCFAEMRFAGFSEDEVVVTMIPEDLVHALKGVEELHKCGFRYPVPSYAPQADARDGAGGRYKTK